MKALKAIKKIAAAGLGFAFIGATIGGAMATDLGDYPAPFATGSGYNGKIIVGEKASAIDIVGAVNIASSFTNLEGAGSVIVETPKGKVVNAVAFDELDEDGKDPDEMPMKGETRMLKFDDDDVEWAFMQGYDMKKITEDLNITIKADVGDDDCEPDNEVIKIDTFNYTFIDESDDLKDEIKDFVKDAGDAGTADFEYQITLFGKEYLVVGDDVTQEDLSSGNLTLQLANADETVQAGDEINLATYGYEGYKLKITRIVESASSSGQYGTVFVALMKDGVQVDDATIAENGNAKLKDKGEDIEVRIDVSNVYWDASNSEYFAEISFEAGVLDPGEDYFDENEIWILEKLEVDPVNNILTIEVIYTSPDDDLECELEDNELYVGNTLSLLGYLELGFVGLSEPNTAEVDIFIDKNGNLIIDPDDSVEVKIGEFDGKGSKMEFEFDGADSWDLTKFEGEDDDDVTGIDLSTDTLYLYLDKDNKYEITIDDVNGTMDNDPKDDILVIKEPTTLITPENTIEIRKLGDDDWASNVYENATGDYVALKEGQKTDLGTELVNYHSYNQEATISIVSDAIRYLVYAGQNVESEGNEVELEVGDTAPAGAKVAAVGAKPLPVGLAILDSELSSPDAVKDDNYIVVGGPCANSAAAALMGIEDLTTCDVAFADEGYSAGEAVIKLYKNDGNFQLLVAGYNGEDTLLATEVLASYDKFKDEFEGEKEVKVKGTALADVEIEG